MTDISCVTVIVGRQPAWHWACWLLLTADCCWLIVKIRSYAQYWTNQLMLYSEIIALCSQIRTEHINTLCIWCTYASFLKLTVGLMSVRAGHWTDYHGTWYWLLYVNLSKSRLVKIGQKYSWDWSGTHMYIHMSLDCAGRRRVFGDQVETSKHMFHVKYIFPPKPHCLCDMSNTAEPERLWIPNVRFACRIMETNTRSAIHRLFCAAVIGFVRVWGLRSFVVWRCALCHWVKIGSWRVGTT